VVDYLADLESDFSRFHRVDDMTQLDGPRFFRMAWRMAAYRGVLYMRMQAEAQDAEESGTVNTRSESVRTVDFAAMAAQNPDLFERRTV
jgi:hypothetical protein